MSDLSILVAVNNITTQFKNSFEGFCLQQQQTYFSCPAPPHSLLIFVFCCLFSFAPFLTSRSSERNDTMRTDQRLPQCRFSRFICLCQGHKCRSNRKVTGVHRTRSLSGRYLTYSSCGARPGTTPRPGWRSRVFEESLEPATCGKSPWPLPDRRGQIWESTLINCLNSSIYFIWVFTSLEFSERHEVTWPCPQWLGQSANQKALFIIYWPIRGQYSPAQQRRRSPQSPPSYQRSSPLGSTRRNGNCLLVGKKQEWRRLIGWIVSPLKSWLPSISGSTGLWRAPVAESRILHWTTPLLVTT